MSNYIDLRRLATRESEQVEWKANVADIDDVVETLSAFANDLANLGGGYFVCGASETKDEHGFPFMDLTGLTATRLKEIEGIVLTRCRDRVSPSIVPLVEEHAASTPDRRVLIFIMPATGQAHMFRRGDAGAKYFVRIGRATREARNGVLRELLVRKGTLEPWDRQPCTTATVDDIDLLVLRDALQRMSIFSPDSSVETYLSEELQLSAFVPPLCARDPLSGILRPRNFALLLFGRAVQRFVPGAVSIFSIYPGRDRSESHAERHELAGNLIEQARRLVDLLDAQTYIAFDKSDLVKPNAVKYPSRALREVMINALAHRDYSLVDPARFTVFLDRIEMVSPGALPMGVDPSEFRSGRAAPKWRNQALAWFFSRLQFAQAEGQGIPTVLRSMSQEGCPPPVFETSESRVICVLPAHPRHAVALAARERERKKAILMSSRNAIEKATQRARRLLENDFSSQIEGTYDIFRSGVIAARGGAHLSEPELLLREKIVASIEHKRAAGMKAAAAVADCIRDAAFTTLNRFVALKMLEARNLVQECITEGELSGGYREFYGMAPGVALLSDGAGYRLYIESLFDELSCEVKVLFDRRDPAGVLWPKRAIFEELLEILNGPDLRNVWEEDETIGWVYQFFNSGEERRAMRDASQAPRNSRELAVRNQFFTPRYVVQFLTDNTLGRVWYEMRQGATRLVELCSYMVRRPEETYEPRPKKDPRDLHILDPACGSGHFLLYAFDLLLVIYEEGWADTAAPLSEATGRTLRDDFPALEGLRRELPGLILRHNLHGVDIDPRCAQIAQLALWMRAQRAFRDFGLVQSDRPLIHRANIVIAEPMPGEEDLHAEFLKRLYDPVLAKHFETLVDRMKLAGELGLLLRVEELVQSQVNKGETLPLFAPPAERLRSALASFADEAAATQQARRRLFRDDAVQGLGLVEIAEKRFDVVLMNPPFGAGGAGAKKDFERAYPRTRNDIFAAFVERGIELLHPRGRLGAITSRTGFFLSSFSKWREEILLERAPPVVFADLGYGVLDGAMVETAAYCLEVRP